MKFSELSLAERDAGLSYSAETLSLFGEKRGYGISVSDEGEEYVVKIYALLPVQSEKAASEAVAALAESLPKNAVNSQRCGADLIEIRLCRDLFLQENLPLLFDFLDALTAALVEAGIRGAPLRLPPKKAERVAEKEACAPKIRLSFDFRSVLGLLGALVGAAAMVFISSALVEVRTTNSLGSAFAEIGSYILAAAAVFLIFSDYRFLARKLDAFGVIICPVLSVLCAFCSALLVTAKAYAALRGGTVLEALSGLGGLYEESPELAAFGGGYLAAGLVISVFSSVLYCLWYFHRHPDEMILSEKAEKREERK